MSQNPDWILYLQSLNWDVAIKITLAALLGAIVGLEREWEITQRGSARTWP